MSDAVVVGGGVIGLSVAWRAATRGLSVTLVDTAPGSGASHHAAGMLAPVTEAHYGEERIIALNVAAAAAYPAYTEELQDLTGHHVGYRACGTLAVAFDIDDRAALAELHGFQRKLGLTSELLSGRECRALEPMLAPSVRGGLFVAGDHQVDNRRLVGALLDACRRCGVKVVNDHVRSIDVDGDRVQGVALSNGGVLRGDAVVLAAGAWSPTLLPDKDAPRVRPVKGQILRLHGPADFLHRNVRALVTGASIYLVPRADGELVVGATVEEQAFDTAVTAGATYELLRDARAVVPGTSESTLVEVTAGLRPATPDNAPLIGETKIDGLYLATGHYRNGVLQAPVTGAAIAALLAGEDAPEIVTPFTPLRFERTPASL